MSWFAVVDRALECFVVEARLTRRVRNKHCQCRCDLRLAGGIGTRAMYSTLMSGNSRTGLDAARCFQR